MKHLLIIIVLIFLSNKFVLGQNNCDCESNPEYKSFISCDTIIFDNGATLYRQFNCDSSWLTFETSRLTKKVLFSLSKDLIDLTPRLGYQFVKEYSKVVLFEKRQASGGGYPINYVLIKKDTGEIFKELGPILFYSEKLTNEIIVTLINDSIPLLSFYNIKTDIIKNYPVSDKENDMTIFMSNEMFPENHFSNALMTENEFEIDYSFKKTDSKDWHKSKIIIELTTKNNR